jgi:hypothetical protein
MEIQQETAVGEAKDSSDSESEESARVLTRKGMAEAFQHLESFPYFQDSDPDTDRSSQVVRGVTRCWELISTEA